MMCPAPMTAAVLLASVLIGFPQTNPPPPVTPPKEPPAAAKPLLAVDTPAVTLQVERCVFCDASTVLGTFSERVFDKNRAGALEHVSVRLDAITKAAGGVNPNRSLTFTVNGQAVDLWSGTATGAGALTVAPKTQANVEGSVRDLRPGEYNLTLRFVSPSSDDNDAEKVTLAIQVRDKPWVPLLVILLGVGVSFLTKKVFVAARDRVTLLARISQLDASWLRNEPPSSAVVWAQANLRLAKMLARRVWLNVPDMISARLADVEALLPTLRAIRDMRTALEASVGDQLALARSLGKLQVLTSRCSNPPLTATTKKQIEDDLGGMAAWVRSEQLADALWKDRVPSIASFIANINISVMASAGARDVSRDLVVTLQAAIDLGKTPNNVFALYEKYAALEVFWQHRTDAALLDRMTDAYKSSQSVRQLFQISDQDAWERLKDGTHLEVVGPTVPPQAFEPFTLRVIAGDPDVGESYLFNYKLRYRWTITITSARGTIELTPETLEPAVTQYAPWAAHVQATVTIWHETGESLQATKPATVKIEKSEAIPLVGASQRAEGGPLLLAGVIAVLTGLSTQYFGNPTFGSAKDYLMLFLTGAAVDWAKNAVQPAPAPAPAPSPPAQK